MSSNEQPGAAKGPMRIRMGTAGDADAIVRFNRAMARETEDWDLPLERVGPGVDAVFESPDIGFYVIAECEGDPVGGLLVTYEWSDWRNATFWWIQSVYIRPEFRRGGIYSRLYEFVRERARDDGGVCGFRLYVEKENHGAQNAYESLGMTESIYLMYEETLER
jgi:GNAT superfamily N-acetyltransferase